MHNVILIKKYIHENIFKKDRSFSKCYILTALLDALLKTGVMLGLQRRPLLDLKASNLQKACKTKYLVYRINNNHDSRAYNV